MNDALFEKIGLTKGEIKVYTALLSLGETTISPIVTHGKVTKSKVYDILEKLIEKGFVREIDDEKGKAITLTDKGFLYIDSYKEITSFISEFDL